MKYYLRCFCSVFLICQFQSCLCLAQIAERKVNDCQEQRIARLIKTLEPTNFLRVALESGARGTFERAEWMDKMDGLSVRQASFTMSFSGVASRTKINLTSVNYYYGYFDDSTNVSKSTLEKIKMSGLGKQLLTLAEEIADQQAVRVVAKFQLDNPQFARKDQEFCGKVFINFLDDESLPKLEPVSIIETECK